MVYLDADTREPEWCCILLEIGGGERFLFLQKINFTTPLDCIIMMIMKNTKTIERNCRECNKLFYADPREVNRGNAFYCSLSCASRYNNKANGVAYEIICKTCGTKTLAGRTNTLYCSVRCKNRYFNGKRSYSNKKIIAALPCELCGWDRGIRDVHHIIGVKDNGTDELVNLISVCPNDHRLIHSNLISQEQLIKAVNKRTISSSGMVNPELDANVVIKETKLLH